MKALVTGGLGFIGSHVADLLVSKGMTVTVLDNLSTGVWEYKNEMVEYVIQDILKTEASFFQQFDYIFHLAALPRIQLSFTEPLEHEEANVIATIKILESVKNSPQLKKLVFSASSACYGTPKNTPTTELEPVDPLSPYALQKYAAEQYCIMLGQMFQIPTVCLRYFNAYGPRSFNPKNKYNAYTSVIGIFHQQRSNNEMLTITGDGAQQRDFVHVFDIAEANFAAAVSDKFHQIYNVGFGECISILDAAKLFNHPYTFIPERKGESMITLADISKIKKDLNWSPKLNLLQGIETYNQ